MAGWTSQRAVTDTEPISVPAELPSVGSRTPAVRSTKRTSSPGPWRRPGVWIGLLALAVIGVVTFIAVRRGQSANQASGELQRTARVERRDFVRSVRVNGTVEAVEAHPIEAPRLAIQSAVTVTITKLLPTGTHVRKGDLVAEFDHQTQVRDALDREAEFNDFNQQINKLQATQASDKSVDDTEMKQAEDAVSNASLEVKRSEVMSRIDAEKKKEDFDEATARLKQLKETYLIKRQSAAAALRLLEIQRDAKRIAMDHSKKNADLLTIHSPTDGLVVVNSTFKNSGFSEWQEGDQVRAGTAFMQVVNPSAMRVRAPVNQQDMPGLHVGQKVDVRLDAYPEMVFHGSVDQISSIGIADDFSPQLHTFVVIFSIDGADPKLLPDLSAGVDVELERIPNALVVPRDALVVEGGKTYVRVASGSSSSKREVTVSRINEVDAVLESGVQPGETVIRGVAPDSLHVAAAAPTPAAVPAPVATPGKK